MNLMDLKTIREVATEAGIPYRTLQDRLLLKSFNMIENVDYRKMGAGQSTILSPKGIKKLLHTTKGC